MAVNPFEDSKERDRRLKQSIGLDVATVLNAPDNAGHRVIARVSTKTGDGETLSGSEAPTVTVDVHGDIALPKPGDTVVLARFKDRRPVILGVIYTREHPPQDYASDERHISGDGGVFIEGPFGVVPKLDADPTNAPDGAVWYRTDLDEYRGVEGGTTVRFNTTAV